MGEHIGQAGSLVTPERLRFDFTHYKAMTKEEIIQVEDIVTNIISECFPVQKKLMGLAEAKQAGAIAFFGDKYGEQVRVIQFGQSAELCGGTHVSNTSEILAFKILKESSPGAGMRRIEAIAGKEALAYMRGQTYMAADVAKVLQTTPDNVLASVQDLLHKLQEAREKKSSAAKSIQFDPQKIEQSKKNINGFEVFVFNFLDLASMDEMRDMADRLRQKYSKAIVVFGALSGQKALVLIAASKAIAPKPVNCNLIVKEISSHIQGGGGGRPDFVQAGGKNTEGIDAALQAAQDFISNQIK